MYIVYKLSYMYKCIVLFSRVKHSFNLVQNKTMIINGKISKNIKFDLVFTLGFSGIVNIFCITFVSWKTTECIIKYLNKAQGTKVDYTYTAKTNQFPVISVCAVRTTDKPPGLKWNVSHLNHCGIER